MVGFPAADRFGPDAKQAREEDWKVSRGFRELRAVYTDGTTHRLGTFPDTAHGRERADKAFQEARDQGWLGLEKVARIELVPMGVRGGAVSTPTRGTDTFGEARPPDGGTASHPDLDAAVSRHPAGGARCVPGSYLCRPKVMAGPSGTALRHAFDCPDSPGERIDLKGYVGVGERAGITLPRRGWRGTRW